MMVYHGTKADVSEFLQEKSPEGFYLSDSRVMASAFAQNYGGNIMPVFLNMKAPADFEQYESALSDVIGYRDAVPSRLSGMGHDGVLIPTVAGDTTYIILPFVPIKSATGNNGAYSRDNSVLTTALPRLVHARLV